jgi:serine/threonine-protein kinase
MRADLVAALPESAELGAPAPARRARTGRRRWLAVLPVAGGLAVLGLIAWFVVSLLAPSGQGRVGVPEVAGQPIDSASAALQRAGLRGSRHPVPCQPGTERPAPCQASQVGTVLRSKPEHGSKVGPSSVVQLYVAAPAQQVGIPNGLSGSTVAAATARLGKVGLRVAAQPQQRTTGDPALAGKVVATNPAGGEKVTKGSTVTLVVGAKPAAPSITSPSPTTSPAPTTSPSPTTSP